MEPENHPEMKRKITFQTSIFGFHVNFQGCKHMVHCAEVAATSTPARGHGQHPSEAGRVHRVHPTAVITN